MSKRKKPRTWMKFVATKTTSSLSFPSFHEFQFLFLCIWKLTVVDLVQSLWSFFLGFLLGLVSSKHRPWLPPTAGSRGAEARERQGSCWHCVARKHLEPRGTLLSCGLQHRKECTQIHGSCQTFTSQTWLLLTSHVFESRLCKVDHQALSSSQ
jgi:hypothetical protein